METNTNADNFVSIFDIPDVEAEGKKNFYCKVKNYETDEWEVVFYKRFIDCYIDVINRVYCDYYTKKPPNEFIVEKIKNYLFIDTTNQIRYKVLSNGEKIETNIDHIRKIRRLKYLLTITGECIFFDFSNTEIVGAVQFVKSEGMKGNENAIKIETARYDIDKMDEKEIIELMLMLNDRISVELFDKQKAEERLQEIEDEKELQEIEYKIENTGLSKDQILKYLAIKEQQEKK